MPVVENNLLLRDDLSRMDKVAVVYAFSAQSWFHKLLGFLYMVSLPNSNTQDATRAPTTRSCFPKTPQPQPPTLKQNFSITDRWSATFYSTQNITDDRTMNSIRQTQALNKLELENAVPP